MVTPLPEQPRAAPPAARVRPASVLAAVAISAVVLVTGVSIAVADNQKAHVLGGNAAKFVPADGQVAWVQDNQGTLRMTESARTIGYNSILQLPISAGVTVFNSVGDDIGTAQLWRESSNSFSAGELVQTSDLHRLSNQGLTLLSSHGNSIGFAYSPALLLLPADAAPGASWTSSGKALAEGDVNYTANYTASAPKNADLIAASRLGQAELTRCLQTDGNIVYRDAAGASLLDVTESDLWCEGRGRVAIVGAIGGSPVIQGPPEQAPLAATSGEPKTAPRWATTNTWHSAEVEFGYTDPFFGEQQLKASLAVAPQRTMSGRIVYADQNADDVVAVRLDSGQLKRQWFGHPGGEIITLATVENATIVTTSLRQVVAYSDLGQRLWTMATAELVFAPPVDAGSGSVLIVGLDGTVSRINVLSGEIVWNRKLSADVSLAPRVVNDKVVVTDRAGQISVFELKSGEPVWSEATDIPAIEMAAADGVVILAGMDGYFRAYDANAGAHLWSRWYGGFPVGSVKSGDLVILATTELTMAINARSGLVSWTREGATDLVTDGAKILLLTDSTAVLIDEAGTTVTEWDIPSFALSIYRYALAGVDGFWIFRSNEPAVAVGQP